MRRGAFEDIMSLSAEKLPSALADYFVAWRADEGRITTSVLLAEIIDLLPDVTPVLRAVAAAVGDLADQTHSLSYHNHHHFREVTCLASVLALKTEGLDDNARLKVIIAAMAHDLGHDGAGNSPGGVHTPYRLEDKAFGTIAPLLEQMGVSASSQEEIKLLIRCTDVSSASGGRSPHQEVKDFLRHGTPITNKDLKVIETAPSLQKMIAILCDADLLPSAGLNMDFLTAQGEALAKERGLDQASLKDTLYFLKHIASGGFLSDAGCANFNHRYFALLDAVEAQALEAATPDKKTAPTRTPSFKK